MPDQNTISAGSASEHHEAIVVGAGMCGLRPNLLTSNGPQAGGASINVPRAIEMCVEFTTGLVRFMHDNNKSRFDATKEAEAAWLEEVRRAARKFLCARLYIRSPVCNL